MEYDQIVDELKKFFKPDIVNRRNGELFSYWDELLILNYEYPGTKSLYIEFNHIERFNRNLTEELINNPNEWLNAATEAISEIEFPEISMPDIGVRINGLPSFNEVTISKLRNNHLEKFVSIRCVISKATEVRPAYEKVAFKCLRCGYITEVVQSKDTDLMQEPFAGCENETCGKRGPFNRVDEESITYNHQYLKIQEPLENLRGRQPEFLYVSCADELAGIRKPGDKVIITGILKSRIKVKKEGKTKFLDFLFIANSIQLSDKDYENIVISTKDEEDIIDLSKRTNIQEVIISSIAPSIFGHENIKEGIALQLFSGNGKDMPDGTHKRGDIHILMCGDPGVAKSQFLKFVAGFAPRAMQVSGRSASAAGLTGAAVRDEFDGKWAIEAGALTMAGDGGVCCVDEVDKMNKKDRASIHDALEQQYVNVAKAGVFASLPTACAFLGAANPKYGRYDQYESISSQFNLGDALLSRMDLLFVMQDTPSDKTDEMVARHILNDDYQDPEIIDTELLRKYIAYSKTHCFPVMMEEAKELIIKFFVETRKKRNKDTIPITVRSLEAAKRLAVANAKMRLSNSVETKDATKAIELINKNLREVGIDPETGYLDSAFLESGISGSQREKIRNLKNILDTLCSDMFGNGEAKLDDILDKCAKIGLENPEHLLERMKSKGDVFAINKNTFKLVK